MSSQCSVWPHQRLAGWAAADKNTTRHTVRIHESTLKEDKKKQKNGGVFAIKAVFTGFLFVLYLFILRHRCLQLCAVHVAFVISQVCKEANDDVSENIKLPTILMLIVQESRQGNRQAVVS